MRLAEINRASLPRAGAPAGDAVAGPDGEAGGSRALVALSPVAAKREAPTNFRQAPFLAQLLATEGRHPQTRERRRAEPDEALAAYRDAADLMKWR